MINDDIDNKKYSLISVTRNSYCISDLIYYAKISHGSCFDKWVIVDNGSQEEFLEFLNFIVDGNPKIKIINLDKNYLFSYSTNIGLKEVIETTNSKFSILLNPDIIPIDQDSLTNTPNKDLFESICSYMYHGKIDIAGSILVDSTNKVEHHGAKNNAHLFYMEYFNRNRHLFTNYDIDYVTGALMGIRNDLIKKIGFLDEKSFTHWCSDQEFCLRAKVLGSTIASLPIVWRHNQGSSTGNNPHLESVIDLPDGLEPNLIPFSYDYIRSVANLNSTKVPIAFGH